MDDKRTLLGDLRIDADDREAKGSAGRYLVTAVFAIGLGLGGWWYLFPPAAAVPVATTVVLAASGDRSVASQSVLEASGYVTARRQATVSSKVTGKVAEVFIEEGVQVEKDQLLATLDSSTQSLQFALATAQLSAAEAGLGELRVQLEEAKRTLRRTVELAADRLASEADLDRAKLDVATLSARMTSLGRQIEVSRRSLSLQQQFLDDLEIRAPFAGIVIAKAAQPGEMISPVSAGGGFTRTGICTIVDMDSLEIEVDVNESYINRVTPGQPVAATLNSYPDWQIPAEVITIIPTADRNKATVRVRIGFLERDQRILPDMGVKVSFMEEGAPAEEEEVELTGVLVPPESVRLHEGGSVVFVVEGATASRRSVTLGARVGDKRNVTDGLSAGETIVTDLSADLLQQLQAIGTVEILE